MKRLLKIYFYLIFLLVLNSCQSDLDQLISNAGPDCKRIIKNNNRIFISYFKSAAANKIIIPPLMKALKEEFLYNGRIIVVDDKSRANLLLKGIIINFSDSTAQNNSSFTGSENRLFIHLATRLTEQKSRKLWQKDYNIKDFIIISASMGGQAKSHYYRNDLLKRISQKIVRKTAKGVYLYLKKKCNMK